MQKALDQTMSRWFRGDADAFDVARLFDAGYLRLTPGKLYRHYVATAKGIKAAERFNALAGQ